MGTVDWLEVVRKHGDIAKGIADGITQALCDPNTTIDQLSQLYKLVVRCGRDVERTAEEMGEYDVDDALYEALEALDDIWSELIVAVANKIRVMQGLKPIGIPNDED
jgi:hypothetical protein